MKRGRSSAAAAAQAPEAPIKINVGGQVFWTTKSTLTSTTGHYFHRVFSSWEEQGIAGTHLRDEHGNVFIDRDPRWFSLILNFLRDQWVALPPSTHERQQLRQEALYYGLEDLVHEIESSIDQEPGTENFCTKGLQNPTSEQLMRDVTKTLTAQLTTGLHNIAEGMKDVADAVNDLPVEINGEQLVEEMQRISCRISGLRRTLRNMDGANDDGYGEVLDSE